MFSLGIYYLRVIISGVSRRSATAACTYAHAVQYTKATYVLYELVRVMRIGMSQYSYRLQLSLITHQTLGGAYIHEFLFTLHNLVPHNVRRLIRECNVIKTKTKVFLLTTTSEQLQLLECL